MHVQVYEILQTSNMNPDIKLFKGYSVQIFTSTLQGSKLLANIIIRKNGKQITFLSDIDIPLLEKEFPKPIQLDSPDFNAAAREGVNLNEYEQGIIKFSLTFAAMFKRVDIKDSGLYLLIAKLAQAQGFSHEYFNNLEAKKTEETLDRLLTKRDFRRINEAAPPFPYLPPDVKVGYDLDPRYVHPSLKVNVPKPPTNTTHFDHNRFDLDSDEEEENGQSI